MKFKRILCVLLAAACVSAGGVAGTMTTFAEDTTVKVGDKQSTKPTYNVVSKVDGDELITTISFTVDEDLAAGNFTLNYNTDKLDFVSAEKGGLQDTVIHLVNGKIAGTVTGNFAYLEGYQVGSTDVAVITFKLKDGSFGKDDINLTQFMFSNIDGEEISNETEIQPEYNIICDHEKTKTVVIKKATCDEEGIEDTVCAVCGEVVSSKSLPKTPHSYDEGVVTTEPTCIEKGVKTFTCANCGDTYTEEIPALGHSFDNGVVTTEPTCTEIGAKTYTCSACGDIIVEELPALGHSYDEGVITKEATCEEIGIKTFTCTKCGDAYIQELPKTEHSYDEGVVTKQATTTEKGEKTFTCKVCGKTRTEEIPALGEESKKPSEDSKKNEESSKSNNESEGKKAEAPTTGDSSSAIALAIAAMASAGAVIAMKRKKTND